MPMFSDFVTFKEISLIIDNKASLFNLGIFPLDITHDNKVYQLYLASITESVENTSVKDYLIQLINQNENVQIQVTYEVKKTNSEIVDLYRVIPEKNKLFTIYKKDDNDIFILKCDLLSRNNIYFDDVKVVNY